MDIRNRNWFTININTIRSKKQYLQKFHTKVLVDVHKGPEQILRTKDRAKTKARNLGDEKIFKKRAQFKSAFVR